MENNKYRNTNDINDAEYRQMRKSEDSSYEYHGADAEDIDEANADNGYPEVVEHNESGSVYDLKTDFIVLLPGEIIRMLSQTYEAEQKQLEADTARLRQEIEVQEAENDHLERFIEKARAYVGIKKLDGYILHELISAIYVSAPDKSSGHREQHIRIEYDGIGFIPIHELMAKQTA